MEAFEHIFTEQNFKTQTIGIPDEQTYVLFCGGTLREKKYKVSKGYYIENDSHEIIAKDDFELYVPAKHERIVSFILPPVNHKHNFFVGKLDELLLVELYYTHGFYQRSNFNYTNRQIGYGDAKTSLNIFPSQGVYKLNAVINLPSEKCKHESMFKPGTKGFKVIEKFMMNIKIDPAPKINSYSHGLNKLILKYFPLKSYK